MKTDFIFVYDELMNRSVLRSWLEANGHDSSFVLSLKPAILRNHDYVWNQYSAYAGGGKPSVSHKDGSDIYGVVVEVAEKLLKAFDRREGHPSIYTRGSDKLTVYLVDGNQTVQAWVYVAGDSGGRERTAPPTKQYKNSMLQAAEFWKFPENYISKLRDWDVE